MVIVFGMATNTNMISVIQIMIRTVFLCYFNVMWELRWYRQLCPYLLKRISDTV